MDQPYEASPSRLLAREVASAATDLVSQLRDISLELRWLREAVENLSQQVADRG